MKAQIIGIATVLGLMTIGAAEATTFKVPSRPLISVVMCEGVDFSATITAISANRAKFELSAAQGTLNIKVDTQLDASRVTYTAEGASLEIDLDTSLAGTEDFRGELNAEVEGQRVAGVVTCHGVFTSSKAPSLSAWQ